MREHLGLLALLALVLGLLTWAVVPGPDTCTYAISLHGSQRVDAEVELPCGIDLRERLTDHAP